MATEVKMPQLGLTMTEGIITKWFIKEGEQIKAGEPLLEVETDKLVNEVESPEDGVLLKIVAKEGAEIPVQGLMAFIGEEGEDIPVIAEEKPEAPKVEEKAAPKVEAAKPAAATAPSTTAGGRVKASPLAKRIAADKGLDLSQVAGTGPNGRIIQRDVNKAAQQAAMPAPTAVQQGVRREKMSAMRRAISRNMSHSWETVPMVHYDRQVDTTQLTALKDTLSSAGGKISYTDLLVKVVSVALMEYPLMNAYLEEDEIVYHDFVNMGIAVALEDGLIVPVVKDAHYKGIGKISSEVRELAEKARFNELASDELSGGTFTITNLGMFGMESFTPIVNQPETGILGVNTIKDTPVAEDGKVVIRPMMNLSLVADHRLVDGAVGAAFMQHLCDLIENPWKILL